MDASVIPFDTHRLPGMLQKGGGAPTSGITQALRQAAGSARRSRRTK